MLEYLPGGDLLSFLIKSRKYRSGTNQKYTAEGSFLSSNNLVSFAHQICCGMEHIAKHNVSSYGSQINFRFGFKVWILVFLGLFSKLLQRRKRETPIYILWLIFLNTFWKTFWWYFVVCLHVCFFTLSWLCWLKQSKEKQIFEAVLFILPLFLKCF